MRDPGTVLLSVVIPARNGEANVGTTLDGLRARLLSEGIHYEIIVVDDGSTDGTAEEVAARCRVDRGVHLVRNDGPNGFGRAIRLGLDAFTGDAVVIMMADGSDDPDDVVTYFDVLCNEAECAFGSRFVPGSEVVDYPWLKLRINRIANSIVRFLFGIAYNDTTNAFKGYRREVIQGCAPLISPHFNLTVEIPLKAMVRGYSFKVVPIRWRNRKVGVSSLKLEEQGSRYLYIVLNVWLERLLTRDDYRRTPGGRFEPWQPVRRVERESA
jgi:dolichol-phosphate mannosyltransferase